MSNVEDHVDVGCSSNNSARWNCLLIVAEMVIKGIIELEQLANEIEERRRNLGDFLSQGFKKKGKRSPRKKKVVFDAAASTGEKSGLELIFKASIGVVCTQEAVSRKITIKKLSSQNPDRNPRKRTTNSKEEEGATISTKRAKKSGVAMDPAPDLNEAFKNRILETGGDLESVVLVIQKELTKTDLSTGHGRLSVPYKKVRNEFLKPTEVDHFDKDKRGIKMALIQPSLEECEISLRNWKSNSEYVLVRDWNRVGSRNALREGMKIQLWSFRRNSGDLCLALVKVD